MHKHTHEQVNVSSKSTLKILPCILHLHDTCLKYFMSYLQDTFQKCLAQERNKTAVRHAVPNDVYRSVSVDCTSSFAHGMTRSCVHDANLAGEITSIICNENVQCRGTSTDVFVISG